MKGRRTEERPAPVTLSRPAVHPLPSLSPATPFFPLFSPWATWSRTGRHGNPRQSRWKLNRGTLSILSLSLSLSPSHPLSIPLSPTSPSVPLPLRQRANVFASRSLRRFQIISRPIVLLLTTGRPLCPPYLRSSPLRNPLPIVLAHPRFPVARSR